MTRADIQRNVSDTPATDRELWERVVRGDEQAFAAIYNRHAQRLLTYAYRRSGSRQRAEDTVSLVMLETWRRRHDVRFGDDDSIVGWLFRTARYVLSNDARAARRHRGALARIAQLAPAVIDDVGSHLDDDERLRRALGALAELSSRDRDLLELATWSGLSEAELAAALSIPVGTLKSRLSRARRRLSKLVRLESTLRCGPICQHPGGREVTIQENGPASPRLRPERVDADKRVIGDEVRGASMAAPVRSRVAQLLIATRVIGSRRPLVTAVATMGALTLVVVVITALGVASPVAGHAPRDAGNVASKNLGKWELVSDVSPSWTALPEFRL